MQGFSALEILSAKIVVWFTLIHSGYILLFLNIFCDAFLVSFLLGRFPGLYTFKFPKVSFRFVISNRKIKIGRKTIRLKPSSNKKFIGWWSFPYRRVTYYIRFTSKGIRILTIKGKKVVPGKTIRKIVKPKNKGKNPKKNKNKGKNPKKNKNKGKNPKKNKNKGKNPKKNKNKGKNPKKPKNKGKSSEIWNIFV